MSDDIERRLSEARDGLHRPDAERMSQIEAAVLGELPARQLRRRAQGPRRRWFVMAIGLALVAAASAIASGRLEDLFSSTPPPEVSRAFLEVGGIEAPNSPRGTTSTRRPPTAVAARLVVADTPWGRYTYWRGLDGHGQLEDLVQDPSGGFAGGGPCLAFDPVLPPGKAATVPAVIGLPWSEARARLRAAGFAVRVASGARAPGADVVISTLPHSGASAFQGGAVQVVLGPKRLVRPVLPQVAPPPSGHVLLCGSATAEPNKTPTIVEGALAADVASAEIAYADGRTMPAFVSNHSILVVVPPQTCAFGLEPPRALILRDAAGKELDRVTLGTRGFDLGGWEANGPPECTKTHLPAAGVASLFSVLLGAQQPDDVLPVPIRASGNQHLRPATSRLIGVRRGWTLYAVTAKPFPAAPETVCLVDVRQGKTLHRLNLSGGFLYGPGGRAGADCPSAKAFVSSFQASVLRLVAKSAVVAGLVPDGFTVMHAGARSVPISDNAYLIEGVHAGTELRATGPAGTRTLRFGGRTGQLPSPNRRVLAR